MDILWNNIYSLNYNDQLYLSHPATAVVDNIIACSCTISFDCMSVNFFVYDELNHSLIFVSQHSFS
jgi:hypothetical protein